MQPPLQSRSDRPAPSCRWDTVIRGARIVDGTGNPPYHGDIAISDGRVAAIGAVKGDGVTEIEADGLAAAPGFVDVHTHSEEILEMPCAENYARMGVTTVITGNCGASAPDVGGFLCQVESLAASLNLGTLVGHSTVRAQVMGDDSNRPPTPAEMVRMEGLVETGMRAGAVGFSTGLIYTPGVFAETDEVVALARVAAERGGIYTSHMRNEATGILDALEEVFQVARQAAMRAEVSHIKLAGDSAWGRTAQVLGAIEGARASGLDITQDMYVYTASSTGLGTLLPADVRAAGPERLAKLRSDPAALAQVFARMTEALAESGREDYSYAVIASYGPDHSLDGMSVPEAARRLRGGDSLDDQMETVFEIACRGGAGAVFHGMCEGDLQAFLRHPNTLIGSDSGPHRPGPDRPHPRGYGNNARVLARYVRELGVLRLEDAVRRMTWLPASTFRLADRGMLREGCWADIVLFDPVTVQDTATYAEPHRYASGIPHVLVNGVPVVRDGAHTGARPGVVLRHV